MQRSYSTTSIILVKGAWNDITKIRALRCCWYGLEYLYPKDEILETGLKQGVWTAWLKRYFHCYLWVLHQSNVVLLINIHCLLYTYTSTFLLLIWYARGLLLCLVLSYISTYCRMHDCLRYHILSLCTAPVISTQVLLLHQFSSLSVHTQ